MPEYQSEQTAGPLEIFISHSHEDHEVAKRLTALLRAALNIEAQKIRCSSVDGYRLPVGAMTNTKLREEVYLARAFVALLTPASLKSSYVLFELGARWGAGKPLAPLLASGTTPKDLKEPLLSLNALTCDEPLQVQQLLEDVAGLLPCSLGSPTTYGELIDELVNASNYHRLKEITFRFQLERRVLDQWVPWAKRKLLGRGTKFNVDLAKIDHECKWPSGTAATLLSRAAAMDSCRILKVQHNSATLIFEKDVDM